MRFTEEVKTEWLKDLRSGKYKQIQHDYKNNRGHCCLAVLEETCKGIFKDSWMDGMTILTESGLLSNSGSLIRANDGEGFDGKYTNVIPLIEKLPTI